MTDETSDLPTSDGNTASTPEPQAAHASDATRVALEAPLDRRRAYAMCGVVALGLIGTVVATGRAPGVAIASGALAACAALAALAFRRRASARPEVRFNPDGSVTFRHRVFFDGEQHLPAGSVRDVVCGPAAWEMYGPPRTGFERSGTHIESGLVRGGGTPNVCIRLREPVTLDRLHDPIPRTGGRYETLLPLPGHALDKLWLRVPDPDAIRTACRGARQKCTWVE